MNKLLKNTTKSYIIVAYEKRSDKLALYEEFFKLSSQWFIIEIIQQQELENKNTVYLLKLARNKL